MTLARETSAKVGTGKRSRAQRDEHRENERPRPARARSPRRVRDPPRHPGRRPGGRRPTLREGRDRKSFGGSRLARAPRAFTFEKRGNNEKCQRAARLRLFGILPAHKFGGSLDQSECGKSEISSRFVGLVGRSGTSVWIRFGTERVWRHCPERASVSARQNGSSQLRGSTVDLFTPSLIASPEFVLERLRVVVE